MKSVFDFTDCDISLMYGECSRFLFHISLIHILTCIVDKKEVVFGMDLFKTLTIATLSILSYHLFFRKLVEPKVEKMKTLCSSLEKQIDTNNIDDRSSNKKQQDIYNSYDD